jgi:hypothetical protein
MIVSPTPDSSAPAHIASGHGRFMAAKMTAAVNSGRIIDETTPVPLRGGTTWQYGPAAE